jgi:hypothetical protein
VSRLCLDHNISMKLAPLLEREGHDVEITRDVGGARWTDDALFLATTQSGRIFITHNRKDFRLLHDAWMTWPAAFGLALPPHPGILLLDQSSPETLMRVLTHFLDATPPERFANGIFWWHRHDGWRQPIAGAQWEPYSPSSEIGQE